MVAFYGEADFLRTVQVRVGRHGSGGGIARVRTDGHKPNEPQSFRYADICVGLCQLSWIGRPGWRTRARHCSSPRRATALEPTADPYSFGRHTGHRHAVIPLA